MLHAVGIIWVRTCKTAASTSIYQHLPASTSIYQVVSNWTSIYQLTRWFPIGSCQSDWGSSSQHWMTVPQDDPKKSPMPRQKTTGQRASYHQSCCWFHCLPEPNGQAPQLLQVIYLQGGSLLGNHRLIYAKIYGFPGLKEFLD